MRLAAHFGQWLVVGRRGRHVRRWQVKAGLIYSQVKKSYHRHKLAHLEWWRAYYHFVRPHESLRVALIQPRERGGNRLAQRYRQRTPAMAAGRTTRRWTAREVLIYPLPKGSA